MKQCPNCGNTEDDLFEPDEELGIDEPFCGRCNIRYSNWIVNKRIIMSIKPQFADKIFSGEKLFEFRRSIFKNKDIKTVIVYSSSPVQKVIGEFEIDSILKESIEDLWNLTHDKSGITEECFKKYFSGKEFGYAIKIKNTNKYIEPLELKKHFNIEHSPQSFIYIDF